MVLDAALAVEVEVGVVGEVDDGGPVRHRREGDPQGVVLAPFVAHHGLEVARIAFFAVLGEVHELHSVILHAAVPHAVHESARASVEMIRTAVHRKGVVLAFKAELARCDAVGISSRAFAQTRSVTDV